MGLLKSATASTRPAPIVALTLGPVIVNVQVYDGPPPNNKMIANIMEYPTEIPPGSASWDFKLTAKDIKKIKQ